MATFADDKAFEVRFDPSEAFEQDIDAFAADDLADEEEEIAIAELAADREFLAAVDGHVNLNFAAGETIAKKFVPTVLRINDEALKAWLSLISRFLAR